VTGGTAAAVGQPFNVVTTSTRSTGTATVRPDLIGDPSVVGSATQWFNNSVCDPRIAAGATGACTSSSVFALPINAAGVTHFGNLPRGAILSPGFSDTDFSLIKNVKLAGSAQRPATRRGVQPVQRLEPRDSGRTALVGSTAFGVITSTRFPTGDSGSARQVQFRGEVPLLVNEGTESTATEGTEDTEVTGGAEQRDERKRFSRGRPASGPAAGPSRATQTT